MDEQRIAELRDVYRTGLLEDTVPFWMRHGQDTEHGGFFTSLGRDGTVVDTDKAIWPQGRFCWLLSTLYNTIEPRDEWLVAATHGIEFLEQHGFDADGKMFFLVTRDGRPLRQRRYVYSEAFASMAFAAYARAVDSDRHASRAVALFEEFVRVSLWPGSIPAKVDPRTRPMTSIGPLMIAINVAQTLRSCLGFERASSCIERCVATIEADFVKPDLQVVMENVGPQGEIVDHFDGRLLNPGHAMEAAWFVLEEARALGGDAHLVRLGTQMLDWMWNRGWDSEYGGLFYFRDVFDRPVQEYWHDMKFWWPHNEAIIATLLAHVLTGEERYESMHQQVHDWAHAHFADREHGEWFGYLHRDGGISSELKGNHWKGPFHLPRMQWHCAGLLTSP